MSVQQGLDPRQITAIAQQLTAQGDQLEQMYQSGTAMMGVLAHAWAGPDTEHFAMSWQQTGPQIDALSTSLREAAKALHQQAQDQVRASGESATGGTTGTTGSGGRPSGPTGDRPWDGVGDFGTGLLVPDQRLIDTAKKIADHTEDGIRAGVDRVTDGINEGIDRVNKGMDWLEERADQARDWGQDKAERLADASLETAEQLLFTGVSGLAGPVALEIGERLGVWQDGHGEAGEVLELSPDGTVDGHPRVRQPTSLEEIMRSTTDAYQNDGTVRITEITHPDGSTAYIVNTPGTQNWERGTTSNPLDALGNLPTINGGSSASSEAVWDAMEKAGIPPGAPILTVGHSQGGMINQALLSDPRFTERFNVTHAVTYGSPVDAIPDTSGARQLHLAHDKDEVPKLDYSNFPRPSRLSDDARVVTLPNPDGVYEHSVGEYVGVGQPLGLPDSTKPPGSLSDLGGDIKGSHDHRLYAESVASSDDPSIRSFENDLDNFIVPTSGGSKVTAVDVEIQRKK